MQISSQIASFICIISGFSFGIYFFWTLTRQHTSKRWPTTTGEILESNLDEDSDSWGPYVRYAYAVKGKRYTNDRLYFYLVNRTSEQAAKKHLACYPIGKAVTIYYNPQKPKEAVLDRRMPLWWPLLGIVSTSFLLVLGAGMWGQ